MIRGKILALCEFWHILQKETGAVDYIDVDIPAIKKTDIAKTLHIFRDGTHYIEVNKEEDK